MMFFHNLIWKAGRIYSINEYGGGEARVFELNTISENYPVVWRQPEIDAKELYHLRFVEKMTQKELAVHFKRSRFQIRTALKKLQNKN